MKIFKFFTAGQDALTITPLDPTYFDDHFVGRSMAAAWKPPKFFASGECFPANDFVSHLPGAIVTGVRAKRILEQVVGEHAEFLPLGTIADTPLFALNVTTVVDCLNHQRSGVTVSRSDSTRILDIAQFVFDPRKVRNVPIFKIPEMKTEIFVSEGFVEAVASHGLSGAGFEDPENVLFVKHVWDGRMSGLPPVKEFAV